MKIFHPLLALIASAADRQLARYVEFLKEEQDPASAYSGSDSHKALGSEGLLTSAA